VTHEEIIEAITSLRPESEWTFSGDNFADIVWLSNDNLPTLQQVKAEILELPKRKQTLIEAAATQKAALLARLGITADEAKLLIG